MGAYTHKECIVETIQHLDKMSPNIMVWINYLDLELKFLLFMSLLNCN